MIKKINKVNNLGLVLSNYTWDINLPTFKQFNIIYGWNGSGKTTLSRLFDAINGTSMEKPDYEIEDEQGNSFKQTDVFPQKIRVFNQDYIQNNVKILESRTNSISVLLGEENKELLEQIENDKRLLDGESTDSKNPGKIYLHAGYIKEKDRKSNERDSKFTEIAKTIGAAIGGNALRDYRKPQSENDFAKLTTKEELSEDELKIYSLSAKQESLAQIPIQALEKIYIESENDNVEVTNLLKDIKDQTEIILQKTVESEIISRLASNQEISQWVEQGYHLHKKISSTTCEFCSQKISSVRLKQLSHHFSEADKKLKNELDSLVEKLKKIYQSINLIQLPDRARFYTNLQKEFDSKKESFETAKTQILTEITGLAEELKSKKSKTTETLVLKTKPKIENFIEEIDEINKIILMHNKTTSEFEIVKNEAIQKLKKHYLSTIFDNVEKLNSEIFKLNKDTQSLREEINEIKKRITNNMIKVSSQHKACEDINKKLTTFLGHQELKFIPQIEKDTNKDGEEKEIVTGYNIMRGDQPAVYLSEGEKTAVAFVYFVVHLGDQEFNINSGIVVMDDPISSLDSNSLYQAFSFLKNAVKNSGQAFILTHNFDFLKLLINWRRGAGGAGYYMIKNDFLNDVRYAYIDKMDKELCEYESEYHYLFKLLKQLLNSQDGTIAKAYPVPNIARKVWDTFLMFSVPNGKSSYKKMDELKTAGFDEQKLDAIYKFTNDQSHVTGSGFDPALVPETKKVVKELFEMMSTISPNHFRIIDEATN